MLLVFILISGRSYGQRTLHQQIDSMAAAYIKGHAGALVVGIHDNGMQKIYYYGETETGNKKLPDSTSVFELGELTETFTGALYADMTIKGIVHADDRLRSFLPVDVPAPVYQKIICQPADESNHNPYTTEQRGELHFTPYVCFPDPAAGPQDIILCDLATHTTGLPAYPCNLKRRKCKDNPYASYSVDNLYSYLKKYTFNKPLGYDYSYSMTGTALLGHALSLKMKKDFDSLLVERILMPFEMTDTRIHLTADQRKRLLTAHSKKGKVTAGWTFDVLASAAGLHSTPHDMMKFLALNLAKSKNYYTDVLDYTHNARVRLTGKNNGMEIALGWKINSLGNEKRVVWQSGMTGGFASYVGFVETNHTGVVILSSAARDVRETAEQILRILEKDRLTTAD